MHRGIKVVLILFCIFLLFLACTLRSGIIVDKSFIPRFALLSLLLLITWFTRAGRSIRIRNDLFVFAFICFYLWSLLSTFWSIESSEALLQSQLVFLSLALFLVISNLTERYPGFEILFIKTHQFVLFLSFGLAFYKISLLEYYDPYKIISISANNNLYAGFLLISLPIVFAGYILCRGIWKYLSVLTGILAFFMIIIIQCRAVYLGTAIAIVLTLTIIILRYREVFTRRNILTGILSIVLLVGGIVIFTQNLDNTRRQYFLEKIRVWEYFRSYEDLQAWNLRKLYPSDQDNYSKMAAFDFSEDYYSNANLRVIFWQKSLGLIAARPLTGVGAGNWRLAVPSIKDPPNPEHTVGNCTYSEPHNEWVRIISELGITGLIISLFLYFLPPCFIFYLLLFRGSKPPLETVLYAAFILGFYLFASFDFPFRRVEHNIVLWSIFAFMLYKNPLPGLKKVPVIKPSTVLSVIFLFLLLFSVLISVARFRGEYYTVLMFRNERKDDRSVIRYCQKAETPLYRITPNTLPIAWFEGVAHYRLSEDEQARECFIRALKSTPYEVRLLNDYSAVMFRLKRPLDAICTLKATLAIDPYFDDARFNLGAIYYLTGQRDKARTQIVLCRQSQKKQDFLEEMK
jgi:O-antigen ligase